MGAWAAVASAISTSSSSSSLSSDSDCDPEADSDSSLSDELSFLSLVTPGSGSELSSEDSSPELDSGLATTFAGEVLVVDAFVVAFVVTGLVGASSEAEDSSSDDSSFDDASLDSSLELYAAAPVPFVGGAFTARASVGTGLDFAVFVPAVALGRAAFASAALVAGFDGSSSDSPLSESSSLSLSLTGFAEALVRAVFEGTGFGIALVAPALVVAALFVGSSSDSLSLDSEEEPVLGGGALDYMGD